MNFTRALLAVALIAFSCITYSHALKCNICNSKNDCRKPKKLECNQHNADDTRRYLDVHYKGVNPAATSNQYTCINDVLKVSTGEFHWKGCTYSNVGGCSLQLRDHYTHSKFERSCRLCQNKDGCNPAGRAAIDIWTLPAMVAVAAIAQYLWRN